MLNREQEVEQAAKHPDVIKNVIKKQGRYVEPSYSPSNPPPYPVTSVNGQQGDVLIPQTEGSRIWYATCSTAAGTGAKTATSSTGDFVLQTGAMVRLKCTTANTAANPTISIDGSTAKTIQPKSGTSGMAYRWRAQEVIDLVYDGSNFIMSLGPEADTSFYGITKLNSATNSTSTTEAATPSAVKAAYDLADGKVSKTGDTMSGALTVSSGNITASTGSVIAGTDGNTAAERQISCRSGAGTVYLYSQASTTGSRGLYVPAHGTGAAKAVILIDTNNNCSFNGNAATATKATRDSDNNAINTTYIKKIQSGEADNDILGACTGGGENWFYRIATLTVIGTYGNYPISFDIVNRGVEVSRVQVMFNSANNTDPTLKSFTTNASDAFFIKKVATSTWDVIGQYSETWGRAVLLRVIHAAPSKVTVVVKMENMGTETPADMTRASPSGNVWKANRATNDIDGSDIRVKYFNVYNTNNVNKSSTLTFNDLAKQGWAGGMFNPATDNPRGAAGWTMGYTASWTKNQNAEWLWQIANQPRSGGFGTERMWYRSVVSGGITGQGWVTLQDSKLLWTNASPNTEFAAQKVSLTLTGFDAVRIVFYPFSGSDPTTGVVEIPVGKSGNLFYMYLNTSTTGSAIAFLNGTSRTCSVATDGVTFSTGNMVYNNGVYTSWNGRSVPWKIYGVHW